jgi:hypothetical protein
MESKENKFLGINSIRRIQDCKYNNIREEKGYLL